MSTEMIVVLLGVTGMVTALVKEAMRPGLVLFSIVVFFMCAGVISPREVLEGFSNKGMITVALLFLVSEGICQSGALAELIKRLLPGGKTTVARSLLRMLPAVAAISAFLNNTPVVVIFAPIIKQWSQRVRIPAIKFLIPLSYATILGGMCTLIGTSTNLVVYGMILDVGHKPFSMFELAKIGIPIAVIGITYMVVFSNRMLPTIRRDREENGDDGKKYIVEAVIGPRFPGIKSTVKEFNFPRHYGAKIMEIKRAGETIRDGVEAAVFKDGDTLVLDADDMFVPTWGNSTAFLMLADKNELEEKGYFSKKKTKWIALGLMLVMIGGATVGELPFMTEIFPNVKLDMFFFVSVTTVIMAWIKLFPPKKYTKYISWDILITIACAFAISRAMENSGFAGMIAGYIISIAESIGPHALLAIVFIITNVFTELITNNAAAALAFPIALSVAQQLDVNPMPFFVVICVAASTSFSSPIGYQTNLIVQGIGNYKFKDFVKFGLPLNLISFLLSVFLIPLFWRF